MIKMQLIKVFLKNIPRSFCIKYNNTIASSNYPPGISSHVNPSGVIYDFLFDVDKSFLKYNKGFFSIKKKNLLLRITLYRGTAGGELGLNVRDGVNPEYSHYRKKDVVYDSIILKLNQNMEFYIYCTIDNTLIGVIEDFCFYS
jgi:hypothetical protein